MEKSLATTQIFQGDCLEKMKDLDADSVDLIFCDLPYNQTSCKWDQAVLDLEQFWIQVMRIKKLHTPIFFTTTTKFGVSLIQSAPKKCFFRYDLVWVKSAPAGFLSAKKMPMRKHEMIYVFYEKLPFYDLSSHTHKFLRDRKEEWCDKNGLYGEDKNVPKVEYKYEPPLPVSVVKQVEPVANEDYDKREKKVRNTIKKEEVFGKGYLEKKVNFRKFDPTLGGKGAPSHLYDPPLPVSVVKQEEHNNHIKDGQIYNGGKGMKVISDGKGHQYNPPLPVSVVKQVEYITEEDLEYETCYGNINIPKHPSSGARWDPPLPNTLLEIKSTRGKHSTEKPVALMEWVFKYYSKEGDVVLDPTMGSGSTGVACKNMNRNFIGIEMDEEIFKVAQSRLNII